MSIDYESIREKNRGRYGTDVRRYGKILLADRYAERSHFMLELLQNAEDALACRPAGWVGPRAVRIVLTGSQLRVSHFGDPFNEHDVRSICNIGESTKKLTNIGRFGIGFKSVYAVSERPEIHSGRDDFAIVDYVLPEAVDPVEREVDETVILLPLTKREENVPVIRAALERLQPRTLLFLRQVEELSWQVEDGRAGLLLRQDEPIDQLARRVTLMGESAGEPTVEEEWLLFRRPAVHKGEEVGNIEIAFRLDSDTGRKGTRLCRVRVSPLFVYFPTAVETHLGFLAQGPYRTTPSRDNVPPDDEWNRYCARETGELLADALRWMRDHDYLDGGALGCLPLDTEQFGDDTLFAPVFERTKELLRTEPFLPRHGEGFVAAAGARLARSEGLRELLTPHQLGALLDEEGEVAWVSAEITRDRVPELYGYLRQELGIQELDARDFVRSLREEFLEAQTDEWIAALYEYLADLPYVAEFCRTCPILRLEDGRHVVPGDAGRPNAYLPSEHDTEFPTVRAAVCESEAARAFLESLGLRELDLVDDIVANVLPAYREGRQPDDDDVYAAHIERIVRAYETDSRRQRERLVRSLKEVPFVRAVDAGTGECSWASPQEVYWPTEILGTVFAGVPGVRFVDREAAALTGDEVARLLEDCGAAFHLRPVKVAATLSSERKRELREATGCFGWTNDRESEDRKIHGLTEFLGKLPDLDPDEQAERAEALWDALCALADREGERAFCGTYRWFYYTYREVDFDAKFVQQLNDTPWIPTADGMARPEFVVLEDLGWKPHPIVQAKIRFKPRVVERLAEEAGFEPGMLDLLKQHGITSRADLERFGILKKLEPAESSQGPKTAEEALAQILGREGTPTADAPTDEGEPAAVESVGEGESDDGVTAAAAGSTRPTGRGGRGSFGSRDDGHIDVAELQTEASKAQAESSEPHGETAEPHTDSAERTSRRAKRREADEAAPDEGPAEFVSYVGVHPDQPEADGLTAERRQALEDQAIEMILAWEPNLRRMPQTNPGFDLIERAASGRISRWIEVKAMSGSLQDHPVGLSRAQFQTAQERRDRYWLYVVEHADDPAKARLVCIQDPAGRARTFTFDHGWTAVAQLVELGGHVTNEEDD